MAWTRFVRSSISIACNLLLSCCRTWWNNTLQQCLLKSLPLVVDLKITAHTSLPHWCKYRIFVSLLPNLQASLLWWNHSFDTSGCNFLGYKKLLQFNSLRTSLACVQGFSLMVTTHNSTALKENSITEDIFIKFRVPVRSFLHFAQNYSSSVLKTLQSRCRALMAFYQTSLLPLCNVFCHVYEKSLKWLEIDNISPVSKHEPKSSNKFFCFHLQMDGYW